MAEVVIVLKAISTIIKTVKVIKEICEKCQLLPECAHTLTQRCISFESQIQLLRQNKDKMVQFATPIENLKDVVEDVQEYLIRLSKLNEKGWIKRIINHQSYLEEYETLNSKLDTCRDDLQFQFVVHNNLLTIQQQAYEDDLKGLIELTLDEQRQQRYDDIASLKVMMKDVLEALHEIQQQQQQQQQQQEIEAARKTGLAPPTTTTKPISYVMETAQLILGREMASSSLLSLSNIATSSSSNSGVLIKVDDIRKQLHKLRSQQIQKLYINSNRITLGSKIGHGGFADVYVGKYNNNNNSNNNTTHEEVVVAIKVLRYDSRVIDEMEVLEEVRVQRECSHNEYVVQIYGYTRLEMMQGGHQAVTMIAAIMEYATCGSLADFLSAASTGRDGLIQTTTTDNNNNINTAKLSAKISISSLLHLLQQATLGMEFLHSRCFIHRDIKPRNILLDQRLKPKLCDFGLAREVVGERSGTTRTMTGNVGTYYYMAPEIKAMEGFDDDYYDDGDDDYDDGDDDDDEEMTTDSTRIRYSYTADVYSMGCVLAEACQKLYGGYNNNNNKTTKKVPKKKALPSEFPQTLTYVKNRCLSIVPRERYGRGSNDGILLSKELSKLYSTSQAIDGMSSTTNLFTVAALVAQPDSMKKKKKANSGSGGSTDPTATMTASSTTTSPESGSSKSKSKKFGSIGRVGEDDSNNVGSLPPPARKKIVSSARPGSSSSNNNIGRHNRKPSIGLESNSKSKSNKSAIDSHLAARPSSPTSPAAEDATSPSLEAEVVDVDEITREELLLLESSDHQHVVNNNNNNDDDDGDDDGTTTITTGPPPPQVAATSTEIEVANIDEYKEDKNQHPLTASRPASAIGLVGISLFVGFAILLTWIFDIVAFFPYLIAAIFYLPLPSDFQESRFENNSRNATSLYYNIFQVPYFVICVFPFGFGDVMFRLIGVFATEIIGLVACSLFCATKFGTKCQIYLRNMVAWQRWTIRLMHKSFKLRRDNVLQLQCSLEFWQEHDMDELKNAFRQEHSLGEEDRDHQDKKNDDEISC